MSGYSHTHLRGAALDASFDRVAAAGARTTSLQLAHLAEIDSQGYFLDAGYRSMFRFCVDRKGMSEDIAVQWIRVARVAREHPHVFDAIADKRLTVSAVYLLSKRLTKENGAELLAAAEGRSNKQVYRLLVERFGRQSVLDVPPLAAGSALPLPAAISPVSIRVTSEAPLGLTAPAPTVLHIGPGEVVPDSASAASATEALRPRSRLTPLGQGRYELVAILGREAVEQLEACRDLLGHAVPSGDLADVVARAIALLQAQLRKRRCAATDRPRTGVDAAGKVIRVRNGAPPNGSDRVAMARSTRNPHRIPAAVRRAVWERDGGQCTHVSPDGHRCGERFALQMDHIVPRALGGQSTVENLRLLCRAHNQHAAERAFGRRHVEEKREAAKQRRAAERYYREKDRERTEKRRAEIARQREELGEAFRMLGYRGRDFELALAYCASKAEAPPEERLKYALGCLAPGARRQLPGIEAPCPGAAANP